MKRGGELTRKTQLRAKAKPRVLFVEDGVETHAKPFMLPKLPPIPTSLAKAARKVSRPKTTKARQAAKGKPCMIRLPGCDGGGETTVLCHYRLAGYCGTGMKPSDRAFGAWGCFSCHQKVDFREALTGWSKDQIRLAHAEGVMRSFAILEREDEKLG